MSWHYLAKNVHLNIYWVGAGVASSVCIYDFSVDFLTRGDDGKPNYTWRRNALIRSLALPLSLAIGFTVGPVQGPPLFIALQAQTP